MNKLHIYQLWIKSPLKFPQELELWHQKQIFGHSRPFLPVPHFHFHYFSQGLSKGIEILQLLNQMISSLHQLPFIDITISSITNACQAQKNSCASSLPIFGNILSSLFSKHLLFPSLWQCLAKFSLAIFGTFWRPSCCLCALNMMGWEARRGFTCKDREGCEVITWMMYMFW